MTDDLAAAFAAHAEESLAIAQETFAAAAETWPVPDESAQSSRGRILARYRLLARERAAAETCRTFGWGGTVLAGDDGVTVLLVRGWAQAGDLELDRDQARELGQALLDATVNRLTLP